MKRLRLPKQFAWIAALIIIATIYFPSRYEQIGRILDIFAIVLILFVPCGIKAMNFGYKWILRQSFFVLMLIGNILRKYFKVV